MSLISQASSASSNAAGQSADERPEQQRARHADERNAKRQPRAMHQPREDVATERIGAEQEQWTSGHLDQKSRVNHQSNGTRSAESSRYSRNRRFCRRC